MTDQSGLARVIDWLRARNPEYGEIDLDIDLIDARLIDSLGFTEFLFFLEELRGEEIVLTAESAVVFRTLRGIRDNVLNELAI